MTASVYAFEDLFQKLKVHWMWWPAIGGLVYLLVGALVLVWAYGASRVVIDNAYKFSRTTGRVTISLTRDDDVCRITVEDEGVGIARENAP